MLLNMKACSFPSTGTYIAVISMVIGLISAGVEIFRKRG